MFHWLTALLLWMSADPLAEQRIAPCAYAASEVAYASMPRRPRPRPRPRPGDQGGKPVLDCPNGQCPLPPR